MFDPSPKAVIGSLLAKSEAGALEEAEKDLFAVSDQERSNLARDILNEILG